MSTKRRSNRKNTATEQTTEVTRQTAAPETEAKASTEAQAATEFSEVEVGDGPSASYPKRKGPGQQVVDQLLSDEGCTREQCHNFYGGYHGSGLESWAKKLARGFGGKLLIKQGKNKMTTAYKVVKPEESAS